MPAWPGLSSHNPLRLMNPHMRDCSMLLVGTMLRDTPIWSFRDLNMFSKLQEGLSVRRRRATPYAPADVHSNSQDAWH